MGGPRVRAAAGLLYHGRAAVATPEQEPTQMSGKTTELWNSCESDLALRGCVLHLLGFSHEGNGHCIPCRSISSGIK